ncbi:MAG: arsenate reductase family protein [Chloroflexota bacterium]
MNVQIYGVRKNFDTQKAERYFKERKIKYQYIDVARYGLSKGELQAIKNAVGFDNLVDYEGEEYKARGLRYYNNGIVTEEMLLENLRLLQVPIVRNGRQATVGYRPEVWKTWD